MKTVNEIKDIGAMFATDPGEAFAKVTDALIGITEHLKAQQSQVLVKCPADDPISLPEYTARIRREAMIEALEWCDRLTQSGGVEYSAIADAIARLENGGSL